MPEKKKLLKAAARAGKGKPSGKGPKGGRSKGYGRKGGKG